MATETLYMKVHRRWVCNLVRTWLWEEEKELEKCIEVLVGCLVTDQLTVEERRAIAIEILEFKQTLVGVNKTGRLVREKDTSKYRSLTELVKKKEEKIKYIQLKDDIERNPRKYVDSCSVGKSTQHTRYLDLGFNEILWWRMYGVSNEEDLASPKVQFDGHPLEGGCYLLLDTKKAFEILGGVCNDNDEVKKKCTIYFNNILMQLKAEGKKYNDMSTYEKAIYDRNEICAKYQGLSFPFAVEDKYPQLAMKKEDVKTTDALNIKDTNKNNDFSFPDITEGPEGYKFHERPDDEGKYHSPYGWVDPNGLWYSSGFGGHQVKSDHITRNMPEYEEYYKKNRQRKDDGNPDDYMYAVGNDRLPGEFLLERGWVKMNNPHVYGEPIADYTKELNDPQRMKLIEIVAYFKIGTHPISRQGINWEDITGEADEGHDDEG